jgi:putative sugar O-methyltransferase
VRDGAGWGGFAWQFKTLVPRARCIIVDFAEVFLFSATYLGTLFPAARMAFVGTAPTPTPRRRASGACVVPHTRAHEIERVELDLTVNMVSFRR